LKACGFQARQLIPVEQIDVSNTTCQFERLLSDSGMKKRRYPSDVPAASYRPRCLGANWIT